MQRIAACFGLLVALTASAAWASSIGVYFAPDGSDCDATVGVNEAFNFYILADLYGDAAAAGITGAEFGIRNWPVAWSAVVTPSPAASLSLGNPLLGGCNIAFPSCQPPDADGFVLLHTVDAIATTAVSNLTLYAHGIPNGPNFPCALVNLCDTVFTKICVAQGAALINGPSCSVTVSPATWSTVKCLYGS